MTVRVDVSGLEQFEKFIKQMENGFDDFLRRFLLKEALRVLASTKRLTPIDTGLLRNSWFIGDAKVITTWRAAKKRVAIKKHKKGERRNQRYRMKDTFQASAVVLKNATINSVRKEGTNLVIDIYNPVEYASYVEYGHVTKVGRSGGRSGWVHGEFMCTISIKKIEKQIPKHYNAEFDRWIKSLGGDK